MIASDHGKKHVCPECSTKYYDLKKKVVTCPQCGAKPPVAKAPRASQPVKKPSNMAFGRFR